MDTNTRYKIKTKFILSPTLYIGSYTMYYTRLLVWCVKKYFMIQSVLISNSMHVASAKHSIGIRMPDMSGAMPHPVIGRRGCIFTGHPHETRGRRSTSCDV